MLKEREPCTCRAGTFMCAACRAWSGVQPKPSIKHYVQKRGTRSKKMPLMKDGRLTYTFYSRDTVLLVQRLWLSKKSIGYIAAHTGVPRSSVKRLVSVKLIEDKRR